MSSRAASGEIDRILLDFIQEDIPEVVDPFAAAARECGISREEALERIEGLLDEGRIRSIRALLNPEVIGYTSTLAAVRVPGSAADETAARISGHPGVSHNYLREGEYNIWFTLSLRNGESHRREVERLLEGAVYEDFMLLTALERYKLRVRLPAGSARPDPSSGTGTSPRPAAGKPLPAHGAPRRPRPFAPDELDRDILTVIQEPFPLVAQPWDEIAGKVGITREELLVRLRELKSSGALRRISGALNHRRAGYTANGMACFGLEKGREDEAGRTAAGFPEVSHCYLREVPEHWPFPLFAMIHAGERDACRESASRIAAAIGSEDYRVLFSTKEYKKERIVYDIRE
jgi:DNA-binding Lrp family transcriptional regulator